MACRHLAGTTAPPPPAIRHTPRRRPRWTARARSPSRTVADAHAAPPAADQATASVTGPPCPTAVSVLPSQLLTVKVLPRPVESAQFTSWAFSQRAKASGLLPSMGGVGACYDNAMIESFWSRMQVELLDRRRWRTRLELANAIFDYLGSSITASAATAPWACSARSSSRPANPPPWHEESSPPTPRNRGQTRASRNPGAVHTTGALRLMARRVPVRGPSCGRPYIDAPGSIHPTTEAGRQYHSSTEPRPRRDSWPCGVWFGPPRRAAEAQLRASGLLVLAGWGRRPGEFPQAAVASARNAAPQ
jgi:hypothetical protein